MSSILDKAQQLLGDNKPTTQLFNPLKRRPLKKLTKRELLQLEGEIGGRIFGPLAPNCQRRFFNLDASTWIWYEEYLDNAGVKRSLTTRYEVQDKKILKAQDGAAYTFLEGEELHNFTVAVQMYYEQVMRGVYKRDPQTGEKLDA